MLLFVFLVFVILLLSKELVDCFIMLEILLDEIGDYELDFLVYFLVCFFLFFEFKVNV